MEPNTVPVTVWMNAGLVRWLKGDAGLFGFEQVEGYAPGGLRRGPRSPQNLHERTGTRYMYMQPDS